MVLTKKKNGQIVCGNYNLLKWIIKKFGYYWSEEKRWKLIEESLPKNDEVPCAWDGCRNMSYKLKYNLAGEIIYHYCKKHSIEVDKHLRFFS